MKHVYLILLLFTAFAVSGQSSYWEELNAPPGGAPTKIMQTTSGEVYAEYYDHAVFHSQDNGLHWARIFWPSTDPDTGFASITVGKAGILFAQRNANFTFSPYYDTYVSTDNGSTWQLAVDSSLIHSVCQTASGKWFGIRDADPQYPGLSTEVVRSDDQGVTWTTVTVINNALYTGNHLSVDDYDRLVLDLSFYYLVSFSPDEGQTWFEAFGNFTYDDYVITLQNTVLSWSPGSKMIINRNASGVSAPVTIDSLNNGAFVRIAGLYLSTNSTDIYAVGSSQSLTPSVYYYYKSSDDGLTWTPLPGVSDFYTLPVFMHLADNSLISVRQFAMYRSADNGQNWFFSTYGIARNQITKLEVLGDSLWFAMTYAGLWKTTDAGQQWTLLKPLNKDYNYHYGESFAADASGRLLMCAGDSVLLSSDFGTGFSAVTPPDYGGNSFKKVGIHSLTGSLFVAGNHGTLRSADNGGSWNYVTDSLFLRKMLPHPSGTLYALMDSFPPAFQGAQYYLYRSTDDGLHWHLLLDNYITDFSISPLGEIFACFPYTTYRSTDNGNTWIVQNTGNYFSYFYANQANQLFAIGDADDLRESVDFGLSWQVVPKIPELSGEFYSYPGSLDFDPAGRMYAPALPYGNYGFLFRTAHSTAAGAYLEGTVYKDADGDCNTADPGTLLNNWIVRADGNDTWFANTDSLGHYTMFLDTGTYFLTTKPALDLLWQTCADSVAVQLPALLDTVQQDMPVLAIADCPYMTVDVIVPWVERCFSSFVYVQYCNLGTEPADSAWVDVMLDPYLTFTDTLSSYQYLGNNTYRFLLGTVSSGDCGALHFSVYTDCDSTLLGQTLCVSAHVYPDSLCVPIPNWSGAQIQVTARCQQDTAVVFEVLNTGTVPTQSLYYYVIEDDVVLMNGYEAYDPGDPKTFSLPANGHFRRFESNQEPGHPFSMKVAAWEEGCGGLDFAGFPNWYVLNNGIPSEDVACTEITGSFDPNDKRGFPLGYGAEHLIEPNTGIEYLIRFQNTGTAAAHQVVVRDTLSAFLDPATIRVGPASHPFLWSLDGQGFLTVTFPDIDLPDSNANEAASHGFVSFRISQKPDLPNGTEIRNTASIYFDYNGAVRTNETVHRIGRDFIEIVPAKEPGAPALSIRVAPNPVSESALLTFESLESGAYQFRLTDAAGREIRTISFEGNSLLFQRERLPAGVYFFQIIDSQGKMKGAGKLMLR